MARNEPLVVRLRLPWWWKFYVYVLKFFQDAGVLIVDTRVAAQFIGRHIRFYRRLDSGKFVRYRKR